MKKLIKKNEFYDGVQDKNDYIEIFINPTSNEVNDCRKQDGDVRGLLYSDGKCFIWSSCFLHFVVESCINLDFNQYHFFTERNDFIVIHNDENILKENEVRQTLLNCPYLFNIVNKSAILEICNCKMEESDEVKDYKVYLNKFLNENIQKTI